MDIIHDSINILYVDDDSFFRYFVKIGLEEVSPSIHVETVSTVEEALNILDNSFDCVVSDYRLTSMDCIEFAKKVRKENDIAFIIYTGHSSEEIASEAFSAGVDDYVKKDSDPAHMRILANRIRQVVERNRIIKLNMKIMNESEEGILIIQDGKIKYANNKILEMTDYEIDDIIGHEIISLISPYFRDDIINLFKEKIYGNVSKSIHELSIILKNGKSLIVDLKISNIFYLEQHTLLIFIRDATPRRIYKNRLKLLHDYTTGLRLVENIKDVADLTLNAIRNIIGFNTANFFITGNDKLIQIARIGAEIEELEIPLDRKDVCLKAFREKQTIQNIRCNTDIDEKLLSSEKIIKLQQRVTEIAIPIIINNNVFAVLNIESPEIIEKDSDEAKLLEILSMLVTHALLGLKAKENIKNLENKLTALHECVIDFYKTNSVEEIAEKTLTSMENVLGFSQASFGIVKGEKIHFILRKGLIPEGEFYLSLNGPGITVRTVKTGETQHVSDVRGDKDYVAGPSTESLNLRSELAVPVKIDGKVVAVMNALDQRIGAFTDNDRKLLEILAMHVSSSIQQLKSRELEKTRCIKLEALLKHAIDLENDTEIKEIAESTISIIHKTLGIGVASFALVEGDYLKFLSIEGHKIDEFELPLNGRGITVRAARTGEIQLVKDTREDKDFIQDPSGEKVYLSELAVPVKIGSEVVAVLDIQSEEKNAFSEMDQKLVEIISIHTSAALQRLRNLKELKKAEEKYRTILESSLDAVFVISDKKYVYVNKSAAELLGFSDPSELIGADALSCISKEYLDVVKSRISRLQKGEALPKYDVKLLRRDGSEIYAELNSRLIEYEGKNAILSFVHDISDRKSLEEKLNYHNAQLKRIVEERTNELLDAEKMAAVGKITSLISHNIRNPIQTIKNSIYLLKKKPESQEELLEMMEKATDNAIEMLDEIRHIIKETQPRMMKTNLREMINEIVKSSYIPSSVKVTLTIDGDLEFVIIDEIQIRRVIENLIQNAIEAMKAYGELKINARRESNKIILEVADTGPGLSDEAKTNLFRPFFTTKKNGTGLGLYYCKRVIDANKGTISVESRVGEGTIFRIELPVSQNPPN